MSLKDAIQARRYKKSISLEEGGLVLRGPQGPQGERGPQGLPGKDGKDGRDGRNGRDGVDGKDGRDGMDGAPGKNGRDGIDGAPGRDGVNGKDGKDGSPDTPDEVVEKVINSKKKIPRSKIEGLDEALKTLSTPQKASGGMGNWVHEEFSTSSATTAITTSYRIAAAGMAHIIRYNGQVLDYSTHYTISGKTFTFLFTLDDSSKVSIAYVRT